jgi:triacylglycerol lipase
MDSLHLVDPQLRALLDAYPTRTLSAETLGEFRTGRWPVRLGEECDVEPFQGDVRRRDGSTLALRCYRPRAASGALGCILHIHGGGFVRGGAAEVEAIHRPLCEKLQCVIVSVDYRLAPETPFPGAIEDCYSALAWAVAEAPGLGIDRARIGVMGESAGGCLAAALSLMVRDRAEFHLAFQHLLSPALDDRTAVAADPNPFAGEFVWTRASNAFAWSALLGHPPGAPDVSPYAAPARAMNLENLPPTFLGVGALDLFVDEGLEYARRLIRSGVPAELHVYPGAFHGFPRAQQADVALRAERDSLMALRRALCAQPGAAI